MSRDQVIPLSRKARATRLRKELSRWAWPYSAPVVLKQALCCENCSKPLYFLPYLPRIIKLSTFYPFSFILDFIWEPLNLNFCSARVQSLCYGKFHLSEITKEGSTVAQGWHGRLSAKDGAPFLSVWHLYVVIVFAMCTSGYSGWRRRAIVNRVWIGCVLSCLFSIWFIPFGTLNWNSSITFFVSFHRVPNSAVLSWIWVRADNHLSFLCQAPCPCPARCCAPLRCCNRLSSLCHRRKTPSCSSLSK